MPIQTAAIALTTDPTLMATANAGAHVFVRVYKAALGTVYLGSSSVTTGTGTPLSTADTQTFDVTLDPLEALYGTSTGSITVNVFRNRDTS